MLATCFGITEPTSGNTFCVYREYKVYRTRGAAETKGPIRAQILKQKGKNILKAANLIIRTTYIHE